MRRGQRCRSNWSRRAGARPVCGPFEREEAVDRAAAVPPSRSKCIIVYNDRKVRERLCDGCQKVTSAQRHDLNLHVEKTIVLNDAFLVEHRVNTLCGTLANPVVHIVDKNVLCIARHVRATRRPEE